MPKRAENILAEALELPPVERAELVESLLSSFEFKSRKAIDAEWAQEAEDRIDAFDRGAMAAIPVEDVFAEIEKVR
jgi:putative addiction module component (TIGR02574 family)